MVYLAFGNKGEGALDQIIYSVFSCMLYGISYEWPVQMMELRVFSFDPKM